MQSTPTRYTHSSGTHDVCLWLTLPSHLCWHFLFVLTESSLVDGGCDWPWQRPFLLSTAFGFSCFVSTGTCKQLVITIANVKTPVVAWFHTKKQQQQQRQNKKIKIKIKKTENLNTTEIWIFKVTFQGDFSLGFKTYFMRRILDTTFSCSAVGWRRKWNLPSLLQSDLNLYHKKLGSW